MTLTAEATYQQIEQKFISGDLLAARAHADRAVSRYKEEPAWNDRFRVELAKVLLYQGECDRAVALLDAPPASAASAETTLRRLLVLALAHTRLGDWKRAGKALLEASALRLNSPLIAELAASRGSIALEHGDLIGAEELFRQALAGAAGPSKEFLAMQVWMNLGVVSLQMEHYEDAAARFRTASEIARHIGAKVALEKATGNEGWTSYMTGDYPRALSQSLEATAEAAKLGATLDEVQWTKNAGMSQLQLGDRAGAELSDKRSLSLAQSLKNSEESLGAEVALASLFLKSNPNQAEEHIREAIRLSNLRGNPTEKSEPLLLESLLLLNGGKANEAERLLLEIATTLKTAPTDLWAAQSTLGDLYATTGRPAEADLWFQRAILTFHTQRLSLESLELQLPFLANGSSLYGNYVDFLLRQNRAVDALRVLDDSRAETLARGLGESTGRPVSGFSPQALAARLQTTVLVYSLQPEHSYLWAVDAHHMQVSTLPGSERLLPLIERHNAAILASRDLLGQPDSTGRILYDALLGPAAALLPHGSRVLLLPGDGLSRLNFETLIPPGAEPHYWVEDATVTSARSLRMLGRPAVAAPKRANRLLLLGDPVYRTAEYPSLPNAAAEVHRTAEHFTEPTVLARMDATPAAYAAARPGSFDYLHVAAHATAHEMTPLDSAIILSHPGDGGSEKLYAAEILKQPLHARLVTLSSCYGTGTRNYAGEGLVGLVWAFLRAGAHSVIGAQWEVSDAAAPQLMDSLYTRLLAGDAPDTALRAAKLDLIHQGGVFRKPLYWAAFQLYAGR